uniref:DhaL domain-containing protein n=1 Tax=Caenorhabditis japonica TaxID=281687 RepID=A0A8R1EGV3_CAEJA
FAEAAKAIREIQKELNVDQPQTLFKQLSIIFEQTVGGTSGALYALMLSAAAVCFSEICSIGTCVEALDRANQAVQKYGGARVGDRTMIDALNAAVESLQESMKKKDNLDLIRMCEDAASEQAAEATAHQKAAVGRASYTSAEAQTEPDAGATAISTWLRAILKSFTENFKKC